MTSILAHAATPMRSPADGRSLLRACLDLVTFRSLSAKKPVNLGDESEETVQEILKRLEGGHLDFRDVPSRFGSIDHVVLSQAHGIFLIETKPHRGRISIVDAKIRLNGRPPEKDFVAQTLRNTYWLIEEIRAATGLNASINPLILFTHASVELGRPLKGIPMTNRKSLLATMQAQGQPMEPRLWEAREQIAALLTRTVDPHVGGALENPTS